MYYSCDLKMHMKPIYLATFCNYSMCTMNFNIDFSLTHTLQFNFSLT